MCFATVNSQPQTIKKDKDFLTSLIRIALLQYICTTERNAGVAVLRCFKYLKVRFSAGTEIYLLHRFQTGPGRLLVTHPKNMRGSFPRDKKTCASN